MVHMRHFKKKMIDRCRTTMIPLLAITLLVFSPSANGLATVNINELLSTCVDACSRGCAEIRSVQERRAAGGSFQVEFKDATDPKSALTEADGASQAAIVNALRLEWGPGLKIVGEEEDDDREQGSTLTSSNNVAKLRRDLCGELAILEGNELPLAHVTVFVDPLDGTKEFVEGRLNNCQALVGIAVAGKAAAGAIGVPFPNGDLSGESTIVFGQIGAGHGIIGSPFTPSSEAVRSGNLPRPLVASGDSTEPVMVDSRKAVIDRFGGSNVLYGGAGNKILSTALGHVDCTIQPKFGGPWDTCVPEAIIRSMGGQLTDLVGNDIVVYQSNAPKDSNKLGFLATGKYSAIDHKELSSILRALPAVQAYVSRGS
jgi:3'-phosphoadenosine 5'-phosphosulfate (PAPS) 3'-phosphatase